ncbi:MAG: nucleoside phosphorylase [Chitinophagaceae bacterium]|jgi:uridine phosphorylase
MNMIESSELIINARGAIYHLDLRPEEIGDTIITVGDPSRVEKVSKYFDQILFKSQHREFITHTGRIGNKTVSVIATGIGPDNIDIVMNELDALVNIDLVKRTVNPVKKQLKFIRVGTSGSLQPHIDVDSFVASTYGLGLDNLMHFYPVKQTEIEIELLSNFKAQVQLNPNITPYINSASAFLLAQFTDGCKAGITATCPGFYGPQGRNLRMGLAMPNLNEQLTAFRFGNHQITNFEMETSALYGLAAVMGHQALSLSVIVANRLAKKFSADVDATVEKLIKHTIERI